MTWAEDIAQRIGQKKQGDDSARAWQIHRYEVLRSESPRLWNSLVTALSKEVEELKRQLPNARLTLNIPNDKAWIVDGPGLHLEVFRNDSGVTALFGSRWQETFDIDLDPHTGITFTSNDVPETTWRVSQVILKPLGDFLVNRRY
jgi:hypothetical protein